MSDLIDEIIRKQGICFNGITESKHSHIDGNDLVFRSDVHKVFKQILPEIISLCQPQWISVETEMPPADEVVKWWLVGKSPDECWHDSSGNPIAPNAKPYMYECKYLCWSAIMKPSHWQHLPSPPEESK